jgi:hypothetical protein
MATTTTNFGWDIPQSTDLVKDGATAIAALGQDIDTALVDLKGGTTGQILAKASNTDLDYSWVTTDDANAIQNAIVDAKGDLIAATANDTPARLAVGTNFGFLQADSAQSTGLLWNNSAWTAYTPTIAAGAGTLTSANASGRYIRIGKLCIVTVRGNIVINGTGSQDIQFSAPFTSGTTIGDAIGIFRETAVTGTTGALRIGNGGVTFFATNYNNTYPGGTGYSVQGTIAYEVA